MIDFKKSLAPIRKEDGGIDHRYTTTINRIIQYAGKEVTDALVSFYNETEASEKKYGFAALKFCLAAHSETEDYELNAIRPRLKAMLQDIGFKPFKVSCLIGAAEFITSKKSSAALDWIQSHSVGLIYEMSGLSERGFSALWIEVSESGNRKVTRQEIRDTASKHPATRQELEAEKRSSGRGRQKSFGNTSNRQSASTVQNTPEPVEVQPSTTEPTIINVTPSSSEVELPDAVSDTEQTTSQAIEKVDESTRSVMRLVEAIKSVSMDDVYGRSELLEMLYPVAHQLENLAEMAKPKLSRR